MVGVFRPVPGTGVVDPGCFGSAVQPPGGRSTHAAVDLLQTVSSGPAGAVKGEAAARPPEAALDGPGGPEKRLGKRSTAHPVAGDAPPSPLAHAPRLVILESPFAPASCPHGPGVCPSLHRPSGLCTHVFRGGCRVLVDYARRAVGDSLKRGEAPMASHLLYTQALDDTRPAERRLGILAGLAWGRAAEATVVYADWGVSDGMAEGIARARAEGRPVEERRLGAPWGPR